MNLIQNIQHKLICQKPNHINQPIFQICNSEQCTNNLLCCYLCQQQNHHKHEMINIKLLISKIIQMQSISQESLALSAQLDNKISQVLNVIDQNRVQLNDVKQVVNSIKKYASYKTTTLMSLLQIPSRFSAISNQSIEIFQNQFSKLFKKFRNYFQLQQKQAAKVNTYISNLKRNIQQVQQSLITLEKYKKQNKFNDVNVLTLFPTQSPDFRPFKPFFSQLLKAPCMQVTATTATMVAAGSQRVIGLQPSLQSNNRIKKWKIKITKLNSWIGVGICHINKLKQANWNFNYSSHQHGSYFISSNGYSWSSFKPQYNSKYEPFTFKTGDIISLQYNPRQKKLKFVKQVQNENKSYMLEIQNNGDPVHPAVNLTSINDSVQIIN